MGAFEPIRIAAPRSLPGRKALGITLMQCMQRTHSALLMVSLLPSHSMQLRGTEAADVVLDIESGGGVLGNLGVILLNLVLPGADDGKVGARRWRRRSRSGKPAHLILNL